VRRSGAVAATLAAVPGTTADAAIQVRGLTKRYGNATVLDDLSFAVRGGVVTGFLGPNGAGKTTTLRILLGLARPSAGEATIFGQRFARLPDPARTVGAALEISGFHPGRSGRNHLRALATLARLPASRVEDVLALVELTKAADRRVGKYSLGMRQRLALAATLLGDPQLLVLDEPANGLDPQGIRWLRDFLRGLAREGRTVLISSHVLAEVAQTVDDVIVIHRGRLVDEGPVQRLQGPQRVSVRSPRLAELAEQIQRHGGQVSRDEDGVLLVSNLAAARIGDLAHDAGLPLHELAPQAASLEEVFLELTADTGVGAE
jgi:ABC-2 type transport system ATP-binding protein